MEYRAREDNVTHTARLFVNIRGCGYPPSVILLQQQTFFRISLISIQPQVTCDKWFETHSVPDSIVTCHYSRANPGLAVTHMDETRDTRDLILCVAIPLIIFLSSAITLVILYAKCCKKFMKKQHPRYGVNSNSEYLINHKTFQEN